MKTVVVIPLLLLFAGCVTKEHSYYTAERPHIQTEQLIAESNRFPEPGKRDTYYWYQKDTSRNMKVGGSGGEYPAYGPTVPYEDYGHWGGRPTYFW
jgi:hypothetical protein